MKAHEFFGALIRAIGILEIVSGLVVLPNLVSLYTQVGGVRVPIVGRTIWSVAANSAVQIVVGVILFACADWLVRLAYGRRTLPDEPDIGLRPLPSLPPAAKTTLLVIVAVGLSALYLRFSRATMPPATDVPGTLHFAVLVAIGSAAMAFMFRRQWRRINAFFGWWSLLVGAAVLVNSMRNGF